MDYESGVKMLAEMMKKGRICTFSTVNDLGQITSRPMTLQQSEFDGDTWFFAARSSDKMQEILTNPQVNIAFNSGNDWVSLSGSAEQVDDIDKMEELWNPVLQAWFPDGVADPELTLIKVHAETAEYWDGANKLVQLFGMAKAAITGEQAELGNNNTIQL